jgi:23S rRNA (cytidine1920-2'-O)/16S rRNA (cytidine1409-2'-O)-methyltransferase
MAKVRLDQLLVARGFAETRAKAQAAIAAGGVTVEGVVATKPGAPVEENAEIAFAPAHPWVSRGGVKLAHALDVFGIDPSGRVCLDVGASTGGFTQVLLARGARRVVAVDVGEGQLAPILRGDPRVVSLERTDARALTAERLGEPPTLVVADVSFIGLAKALVVPLSLAAPHADLIALVKPHFEAGPHRKGVLSEAAARAAIADALTSLDGLEGFVVQRACDSPIRGGDGNLEALVHARR